MNIAFLIVTLSLYVITADGFISFYPQHRSLPVIGDPGDPLFLTPLIESGQIEYARQLASVHLERTDVESYSGFLTINKKYNSNLFFWFFPAELNYTSAPVVVWLQGGPGASSIFGLFAENGPFYINKQYELIPRNISWNQIVNIIYIDNPVGTGYSFTEDDQGYAMNEEDVGRDLYSALIQFFELFPELQSNDFYVTGESYAGKYIPAICYTIHINNKNSSNKINLKGLAIGDGWCDPESMMVYGDYLYQIGLIDYNGKLEFNKREKEIVKYIKQKNFAEAAKKIGSMIMSNNSLFSNLTGFTGHYNLLNYNDSSPYGNEEMFVQEEDVRRSIHVGNLTFHDGREVGDALKNDFANSTKPWIEILVDNYRTVMYNGQLDIVVAYPLTVNFLTTLNWSGAEEYKTAVRQQWYVNEELAGYTKTVKNLTEIVVRNAGHMVPTDQPRWAFQILKNLVTNQPF